jgi:hypothetical protein
MPKAILEVRRSRPIAYLQAIFSAILLVLALISIALFWNTDGPRDRFLASVFFSLILAVYLWHTIRQCLDRTPIVVVGPAGLLLHGSLPDPIPWSTIQSASYSGGLLGRHRVDIEVDLETRARARVGMRLTGDAVVGRPGSTTGISIITKTLDTNAADILAAIKRYWPSEVAGAG